jgi:hypothetical protein
MKLKKKLLILCLTLLSYNSFSQIVLDDTHKGFIKNKAGLNGYLNRSISVSILDSVNTISFYENAMNDQLNIIYFELTIVKRGQEPLLFINTNDGHLSEEIKSALKTASSGNKIYVEKIKAATHDNKVYSLFATAYIVE